MTVRSQRGPSLPKLPAVVVLRERESPDVLVNLEIDALAGAELRSYDVGGVDCAGADLRGCDARMAVLADADLREATLAGGDLRGADVGGATSAEPGCRART